ncbi:hypothetical protein NHX12_023687 [Muraenolepis orangiensis]|uniref:Uncharacterized protein n=1 Tax=Muraenolepis orangiensis TaxID=630683 RepID=A0A9Q0IT06_9TELE|nr:hypothetical protein NHX12_023687 [Muraenolepis orangiensis]
MVPMGTVATGNRFRRGAWKRRVFAAAASSLSAYVLCLRRLRYAGYADNASTARGERRVTGDGRRMRPSHRL